MAISLNERITFTSQPANNNNSDNKDAEKKVVTGGGAIAATTAAARTKAAKSGFDMFDSASKVSKGMKGFTETTKTAADVAKQSKGLFAKVAENARWAKNAILNWGTKFKSMKYVKPLVESKIFRAGAGALGYGFGFITLISGVSDIAKVTSETIESKISN